MKKRTDSDEKYVLDLISQILECPYEWQKTFSDLVGDTCKDGRKRKLAVNGYFEKYNLIVEYREILHFEAVPFMDKRMTISAVSRGEQRRIYDKRKETWAANNGYRFLSVNYDDLEHYQGKRLKRNVVKDLMVLENKLALIVRIKVEMDEERWN